MRKLFVAAAFAVVAGPVAAKNVTIQPTCNTLTCQAAFQTMSEDLIATVDYKALGPAAATGTLGLGVGIVADYVPVDSAAWKKVTGSDFSGIGLAGVQVTKGLPLNIDIGAFYSQVPTTNVKLYGGEVRYAILPGSAVSPALAVRGSYVTVTGVDKFKADSKAVDVSLSKGFPFITPYIGAGYVWGTVDPDDATKTLTGLKKAEVNKTKAYVGVRFSMGLFEVTPEVSEIGSNIAYALRAGFSFSL